jgi:hypothetical protein
MSLVATRRLPPSPINGRLRSSLRLLAGGPALIVALPQQNKQEETFDFNEDGPHFPNVRGRPEKRSSTRAARAEAYANPALASPWFGQTRRWPAKLRRSLSSGGPQHSALGAPAAGSDRSRTSICSARQTGGANCETHGEPAHAAALLSLRQCP